MKINELYDSIIWNDKNSIVVLWHTDDVKSIRPDLDDDQCMFVLRRVEKNHDADIGITWSILEFWADQLFPVEQKELWYYEKVYKDDGDWIEETVMKKRMINDFMSYLDEEE